MHTFFSNRWNLAQLFLVVMGALGWNTLGLAILLERHKYLHTPDWFAIVLIPGMVVFAAVLGWIWAILSYQRPETGDQNPGKLSLKIALRSGGAVFLLGWLICIWIMLRLMNKEPWCLTGVIGSMLGDWLPIGLKITASTIIVSLFSNQWFLRSNKKNLKTAI